MKLRGIDFGNVLGAAGVQGFFGEGYWFHWLFWIVGLRFRGMTFVSKTSTLDHNEGNMPLTHDWRPREWFPICIWLSLFRCIALNSVGLSGPGIRVLLKTGLWQKRIQPFFVSYMPIGKTKEARIAETRAFVNIFSGFLLDFLRRVGIQFNLTCPNTGLDPEELVKESAEHLDLLGKLGVPIMLKINLLVPPVVAVQMASHPACDAICNTNTFAFGKSDKIEWKRLFPNGKSPLEQFGGGGLSGKVLFPLLLDWVTEYTSLEGRKPLNAGGGIMSQHNIDMLVASGLKPGFDSVFIGTVAMVRPWRVQGIINHANYKLDEHMV